MPDRAIKMPDRAIELGELGDDQRGAIRGAIGRLLWNRVPSDRPGD